MPETQNSENSDTSNHTANHSGYEFYDDPLFLTNGDQPLLQLLSYKFDVKSATRTQQSSIDFLFFGVKMRLGVVRFSKSVTVTLSVVDPLLATGKLRLLVERRQRCFSEDRGRAYSVVNRQLKAHDTKDFNSKRKFVWGTQLDSDVCRMTIDVEFSKLVTTSNNVSDPVTFDVSSQHAELVNPGLFLNIMNTTGTQHVKDIMHKLHLSDDKNCTIILGDEDGNVVEGPLIKAHSIILGASSINLANSFQDTSANENGELTLPLFDAPTVTIPGVQALVGFLYEEILKHRDELLVLSQKYQITHLRDACHKALAIDINSTNVVERLRNEGYVSDGNRNCRTLWLECLR